MKSAQVLAKKNPKTYLFWRKAGHQRCFSPTWLRRAEAPRLWASSMTPHGSCPGGAPVTATWKTHREHTICTAADMKRDTYKPKLSGAEGKPQTCATSSLLLTLFFFLHAGKLLLSESEAHRRFGLMRGFLFFCLVFVFCVRDRERGTFLIAGMELQIKRGF